MRCVFISLLWYINDARSRSATLQFSSCCFCNDGDEGWGISTTRTTIYFTKLLHGNRYTGFQRSIPNSAESVQLSYKIRSCCHFSAMKVLLLLLPRPIVKEFCYQNVNFVNSRLLVYITHLSIQHSQIADFHQHLNELGNNQ